MMRGTPAREACQATEPPMAPNPMTPRVSGRMHDSKREAGPKTAPAPHAVAHGAGGTHLNMLSESRSRSRLACIDYRTAVTLLLAGDSPALFMAMTRYSNSMPAS